MYYPMRRDCYWWSIVLLLRPTVIAFAYEARNRGTGVILGIADWRLLVIFYLLGYTNIQARPGLCYNSASLRSGLNEANR